MMKKILVILAAAVCAVACFDDDRNYSATYTLAATFEYGQVFGTDSLYFESQAGAGLGWQDFGFYHKLNEDKTDFLGGFILSRLSGKGDSDENMFRVNSGAGANNSGSYLVYYENPVAADMPENDIVFLSSEVGTCSMIGCYVNTTKEMAEAVRNSFGEGDRFAIKMTGYLDGRKTESQEFVLAEFAKDSLVTSWTPFLLDKLGQVDVVDVEIVSTRDDIPKAFCLDDVVAKVSIAY